MGTVIERTRAEHLSKLLEIIEGADTVLLNTFAANGAIAGRPMALVDRDDDGTLYLTTAIGSTKATEIAADPRVSVSIQTNKGIVVIEGLAKLTQDRAMIDQLWQDSWRLWYPEGRSSPSIAIIVIEPEHATYWDTSLAHGLSFLWRAVKARMRGEPVDTNASDVGTLDLRHH
ncbi:MAG: pyridoxamine 5'-phosphate oxidase family protein [Kofleriaceae bacterium]